MRPRDRIHACTIPDGFTISKTQYTIQTKLNMTSAFHADLHSILRLHELCIHINTSSLTNKASMTTLIPSMV